MPRPSSSRPNPGLTADLDRSGTSFAASVAPHYLLSEYPICNICRPAPVVKSSLRLADSGEHIGTRQDAALPRRLRSWSEPLRPASRTRPSPDNHPRPTKAARWALRPSRRPALRLVSIIILATICGVALHRRAIAYSVRDLGRRHAQVFDASGDTSRSAVERKRVAIQPTLPSYPTPVARSLLPTALPACAQIDLIPVLLYFQIMYLHSKLWPSAQYDVYFPEEAPTTGGTQ